MDISQKYFSDFFAYSHHHTPFLNLIFDWCFWEPFKIKLISIDFPIHHFCIVCLTEYSFMATLTYQSPSSSWHLAVGKSQLWNKCGSCCWEWCLAKREMDSLLCVKDCFIFSPPLSKSRTNLLSFMLLQVGRTQNLHASN